MRALLRARALTYAAFAAEVGLSAPTIAKYVSGLSAPSPEAAERIARFFQIEVEELGVRDQKRRGTKPRAERLDVQALEAARERLSMSVSDLADRAKCTTQAIYAFRAGKANPTAATLQRLARALKMDAADLIAKQPTRAKKGAAKARR